MTVVFNLARECVVSLVNRRDCIRVVRLCRSVYDKLMTCAGGFQRLELPLGRCRGCFLDLPPILCSDQ